ncbi:hypothetical protein KAU19_00940 [Candidatus Parcubacteria bacterium]|nr:hypothetical protein [Candidatus Parcubacteria bacterium]
MDIVIDYNFLYDFAGLPSHILVWRVFWDLYGWLPFSIVFLWAAGYLWLKSRWIKFKKQQKFILLAIDIPRDNRQTPKAVENIFSYLAGAHGTISFIEKWWEGRYQLSMCLEIVSIDGYIQFLIHTPEQFRNLVESAVYSQYPDAEITEVDDYTEGMPTKFPDDEWDIWGCEFIQKINPAYPIKTYKEFEHQMGAPETQYKDTMASLMDLGSSLGKGEQLWFQILLTPIGFEWPEIGDKEISKVIGEKSKSGYNIIDTMLDTLGIWFGYFRDEILGGASAEESKKEEKEDMFKMMNLKPKEKKQVEAIQEKVSRLGFDFKMRFIYLAKKEVMNKPKVCSGFIGFIKQFTHMDLNQLKPDLDKTATRASYFFKDYIINAKKRKIMIGYKDRDDNIGRKPGILNIEELATIWHFPVETVAKAPLLQKTPVRKAEAPAALPTGEKIVSRETLEPIFMEHETHNIKQAMDKEIEKVSGEAGVKGAPPGNLPFA